MIYSTSISLRKKFSCSWLPANVHLKIEITVCSGAKKGRDVILHSK